MILTTIAIEEDGAEKALGRKVILHGEREEICMDLRTIAHGLIRRIEKVAKTAPEKEALRQRFETAFIEGFRMSEEEIDEADAKLHMDMVQGILEALTEEDTEGALLS